MIHHRGKENINKMKSSTMVPFHISLHNFHLSEIAKNQQLKPMTLRFFLFIFVFVYTKKRKLRLFYL